jgi:hypothetical protein
MARWLLSADVKDVLGLKSSSGARWLGDTRQIRTIRTPSGVRLYSAKDVEQLRQERQARACQESTSAAKR